MLLACLHALLAWPTDKAMTAGESLPVAAALGASYSPLYPSLTHTVYAYRERLWSLATVGQERGWPDDALNFLLVVVGPTPGKADPGWSNDFAQRLDNATDFSFTIRIAKGEANIAARTVFGAKCALEMLTHLAATNQLTSALTVSLSPHYPWLKAWARGDESPLQPTHFDSVWADRRTGGIKQQLWAAADAKVIDLQTAAGSDAVWLRTSGGDLGILCNGDSLLKELEGSGKHLHVIESSSLGKRGGNASKVRLLPITEDLGLNDEQPH